MSQHFIVPSHTHHPRFDAGLSKTLGGKGASLAILTAHLGLPVPPAFTITIEAYRQWREEQNITFLENELRHSIATLGGGLGRRLGAGERPLIVSVRSGAPISMPGMMDTILNVGMTRDVEAGLAKEVGVRVAEDIHLRFRSAFSRIVGVPPPTDAWDQLRMAITAVFLSWDSPRATVYRERGGIPHDLGTAVTVQAMVFGTAPGFSGTGVAFTRDPSTGEPIPTGDWLANAQGEDVVDGSHATQPLAALADDAPAVWAELLTTLGTLEKHYRDLCDVEFTVEAGKLWILQTRVGKRSARASVRIAVDRATDPSMTFGRGDAIQAVGEHEMREVLESESLTPELQPLTRGIPASPGIATGRVRLSSDAAVDAAARGEKVILVRRETSPSDIHGMDAAEGILTATGGIVSHAAIVAREWGKVAVVGAGELSLGEDAFFIGTEMVREGEDLTIDGSTGHVFRGALERTQDQHDRHLVALLEWSKELAGDRGEPLATFKAARTLLMTEKT